MLIVCVSICVFVDDDDDGVCVVDDVCVVDGVCVCLYVCLLMMMMVCVCVCVCVCLYVCLLMMMVCVCVCVCGVVDGVCVCVQLALRAGNEKDDESADTVGCCSLRVEHISLHRRLDGQEHVVEFDFLGKDSIRYYNKVPVEKQVRPGAFQLEDT